MGFYSQHFKQINNIKNLNPKYCLCIVFNIVVFVYLLALQHLNLVFHTCDIMFSAKMNRHGNNNNFNNHLIPEKVLYKTRSYEVILNSRKGNI